MEVAIKPLTEADAEVVSRIAHESFAAFVAPDWEASASAHFYERSTPEVLAESIPNSAYIAGAFVQGTMVGFILMPQSSFVRMLFVRPEAMRQGVGRQLWENARAHIEQAFPKVATVELNSSPHAMGFYRRPGFVAISAPFVRDGGRATRMACWLPARSLGAAL